MVTGIFKSKVVLVVSPTINRVFCMILPACLKWSRDSSSKTKKQRHSDRRMERRVDKNSEGFDCEPRDVKKDSGTVTMFAFDVGLGLSEHTAPFDVLMPVLDGEIEIPIDGTSHRLQEGQIIIMSTHKLHALKAVKRFIDDALHDTRIIFIYK